jgi:hypothetical protein
MAQSRFLVHEKKIGSHTHVGIIVGFYVTKKPTTISTAAHTVVYCHQTE